MNLHNLLVDVIAMAAVYRADEFDYEMKIENFSSIKNTMEKYKSAVFEAKGYKWKLVVYPNGNKIKNVTDHISLYLELADTTVELGFEIHSVFHLYLHPGLLQYQRKGSGCFHPLKHKCGFDQFISLAKLTDPTNGYLIKDTCSFRAKIVSVHKLQKTGRGESLLITSIGKPSIATLKWKIHKISDKLKEECLDSNIFQAVQELKTSGSQKMLHLDWKIQLYPKKDDDNEIIDLSLYLTLANTISFSSMSIDQICAEVTLHVLDLAKGTRFSAKDNFWFSNSNPMQGWSTFHNLDRLKKCIVCKEGETCLVEAHVKMLAIAESKRL